MIGAKSFEKSWAGTRSLPLLSLITKAVLTASTIDVGPTPIIVSGGSNPPPSLSFRPLKLCSVLMLGTTRSSSASNRSWQFEIFRRFAEVDWPGRAFVERRNSVRHEGETMMQSPLLCGAAPRLPARNRRGSSRTGHPLAHRFSAEQEARSSEKQGKQNRRLPDASRRGRRSSERCSVAMEWDADHIPSSIRLKAPCPLVNKELARFSDCRD